MILSAIDLSQAQLFFTHFCIQDIFIFNTHKAENQANVKRLKFKTLPQHLFIKQRDLNHLPSALLTWSCPEAVIVVGRGVVCRIASGMTIIEGGGYRIALDTVPWVPGWLTPCNDAARVAVVSLIVGTENTRVYFDKQSSCKHRNVYICKQGNTEIGYGYLVSKVTDQFSYT